MPTTISRYAQNDQPDLPTMTMDEFNARAEDYAEGIINALKEDEFARSQYDFKDKEAMAKLRDEFHQGFHSVIAKHYFLTDASEIPTGAERHSRFG